MSPPACSPHHNHGEFALQPDLSLTHQSPLAVQHLQWSAPPTSITVCFYYLQLWGGQLPPCSRFWSLALDRLSVSWQQYPGWGSLMLSLCPRHPHPPLRHLLTGTCVLICLPSVSPTRSSSVMWKWPGSLGFPQYSEAHYTHSGCSGSTCCVRAACLL